MGFLDGVKDNIIEEVFNEDLQKEVVAALNENIDIPFLSEKTEEKILNSLYDTVEEVIKNAIKKKL